MKSIRYLLLPAAALIGLTLGILFFVGVTVPLDFIDTRLENVASSLLKRDVRIAGPSRLTISPSPRLELGGVTIGNPDGWPDEGGHLLVVENAKAQLSLMRLIQGDFHILNLEFEGVDLNLVTRADHRTNFRFETAKTTAEKPVRTHELSSLDRLSLRNLRLSYRDEFSDTAYTLEIDQAHGFATAEGPLQFSFSGRFGDKPIALNLTGGSLQELLSGAASWMVTDGRLSLADTTLDLSGSFNLAAADRAAYLSLEIERRDLDRIGSLFDLSLPDIGDFDLRSRIAVQPGNLQFTDTRLQALGSSLAADLILSLTGVRPFLAGNIELDVPDPAALGALSGGAGAEAAEPETTEMVSLPWHLLSAIDTDLRLSVADTAAGPLRIHDISAALSLADGDLVVPLSLSLTDLPLSARIDISTSEPVPAITATVSSPGADLDALLAAATNTQAMRANLGTVSLELGAEGATPDELLDDLDFSLQLGPSVFKKDGAVIIATEAAALDYVHERSFSISASGELLGSPLAVDSRYDATAVPGPLLSMQVEACETDLRIDGTGDGSEAGSSTFTLAFQGRKLCGLLDPVDEFVGQTAEFSLLTSGSLTPGLMNTAIEKLSLGQVMLNGELSLAADENGDPRIGGSLFSERIDLVDILSRGGAESGPGTQPITPSPEPSVESDPAENRFLAEKLEQLNDLLAMEVLPLKQLLSADLELAMNIEELHTAALDIADIGFTLVTENGALKHSPFRARIGGSTFTGSAAIDAAATVPVAHFELATRDFTLAELLRDFEIKTVPDISASAVDLDISLKGKTVQEMLLQAGYLFRLEAGRIVIPRETLIPLLVSFKTVDVVVEPGQPTMITLDGDINSQMLTVDISTDGIIDRGADKPINLALQAALADARLEIDGLIKRQVDAGKAEEKMHLSTTLSGSRMDSLNELFGLNMPPLGPYTVEGTIGSGRGDETLRFYDVGLLIGDSVLAGEVSLQVSADQDDELGSIAVQANLDARTIQLNDFRFGDWSAVAENEVQADDDQSDSQPAQNEKRLLNLVSADIARQVNGTIDIEVGEVLSGTDRLGRGELVARLGDGRYIVDKLELDIPGGKVELTGSMHPEPERIRSELFMNVNQFDYGIMARRVRPGSDLKGYVNLLLDLDGVAPTPLELKQHLNGHFKFGVLPEQFQAGVLDLWAVNILTAALPALLTGSSSVVNCLAGDFIVEEGVMRPELFMVDTSKMRVQGKGHVDLGTGEIEFFLKPTPKSASFFSLATPISVTGTILAPDIGVTAGGVVTTIFRQATSVVSVPFQWLFSERMEADGVKVCGEAMQWAEADNRN